MKKLRKILSFTLSVLLLTSAFSVGLSPTAETDPSQNTTLNPVIVNLAKAEGDLDLTRLGGLDWLHMNSRMERKADVQPMLQVTPCNGTDSPLGYVESSPAAYSWSDGTVAAAGSDSTAAVFSWKNGQEGSVGVDIPEEVGYRITVSAVEYPQVLTVICGLRSGQAELLLYVNGEEEPVYTDSNLTAGEPAYTMYTINIRKSNRLEFVYKLTKKTAAEGSLMLGAAALDKLKLTDEVKINVQEVNSSNNRLNLTEVGDIDWLHLAGTTNQDTTSVLVQTRKAEVAPHIQFQAFEDSTGLLLQSDNAVGYSWDAEDSSSKESYSSEPKASKGLVISYRQGDSSSVGDIPEKLEVGGEISVSSSNVAQSLVFAAGAFQSKSEFTIYLNGSGSPAYQGVIEAGNAVTNLYTIKLSAGDSAVIRLKVVRKSNPYGNLFLGGIALSTDLQGLNLKNELASLVESAEAFSTTGLEREAVEVFHNELAYSKGLLQDTGISNETYYEAALYLQAAFDRLKAYAETLSPDFYSPNTKNWLYFGWENDASKSLSTMGGAMYPGGANGSRNGHIQPIRYTVTADGAEYLPDETSPQRRQNTKWYQADGYMNSPVSEWAAGDTGITVKIQHVANRVLEDSATVVFTQVTLSNTANVDKQVELNISASSAVEVPLATNPILQGEEFAIYRQTVPSGKDIKLDFAATATGSATVEQLKGLGDFQTQYTAVKAYYDGMLNGFARPVSLPDDELVNSYLNSMIVMWETMVQVSHGDYEIRGDAGNRCGVYNYDRYFSHDVPNMVEQFIRDGYIDLAKRIMESSYYQRLAYNPQQGYLDAIPKYIIPYATLWQVIDDTERAAYFTEDVKNAIRDAAKNIVTFMTGPDGLMAKSNTLDNGSDYLMVDNFAVMHGYAAYEYLCIQWGWTDEAAWAGERAEIVNNALNDMLDEAMERRGVDWYMSALEDTSGFWTRYQDGSVIYDGNWLGTTFMMSTFPWDAVLRGYDLDGTWANYLDASLDNAFSLKAQRGDIPDDSWGAWWGHEYGAVYNVGMSVPMLYSEKYRTMAVKSYEWLLDNQSAPFQWGESFDKGQNDGDWSKPAAGYETWGLGFIRQGLLEATASVKTDGTVIVGRGIPNEWLLSGTPIEWKNIAINDGRKFGTLKLYAPDPKTVRLQLAGDDAVGHIVLNLPALKDNIGSVSAGSFDNEAGTVTIPGNTKELTVTLKSGIAPVETSILTSISVTPPAKTSYVVGEPFEHSGMNVTAHYENRPDRVVSHYELSGYDTSQPGNQTVTVSYTEGGITKTATFTISVTEERVALTGITAEISTTVYRAGESLDKNSLVVTAHYEDGSGKPVTAYDVSGLDSSTPGVKTLTVTYTEDGVTKTTTFSVTVVLPGDVNGDGDVTAADALMTLQAATSKITLTAAETLAASVDETDGVSASDALLILQYSTHKISQFPIGR